MQWLLILLNLSKVLSAAVALAQARSDRNVGRAELAAEILKDTADDLRTAIETRERVYADIERNPDSLHDDDGFKRNSTNS